MGISNDSVAYYAALVDYYTVQKLQQLPVGMARLYILCFLLQRFQKINDNLVNGLIYHMRKVNTTAKACMEQQVLTFQREDNESVERVGQILSMFLDDSIAESVSFYYNACILSELLEYAEREKDFELADRIKKISPVSWKHVNFYGEYTFRDIGDVVDLEQLINRLVALGQDSATKGGLIGRIPTSETQIDPSGF